MSNIENNDGSLHRELKSRHLTMIAIGGAIADGLFLATGGTLALGGSGGTLLAFIIVSVMVYFMITSLGEMAVNLPVSGSFQTYCSKYISPSFGFAIGWNYWFAWAICIAIELVASAIVMSYWFPNVAAWVWSLIFLAFVLVFNLFSAKIYGESEFWFAGVKVFAIIAFLIVGFLMIMGVVGNPPASGITNFTSGGLFPNGISGVIMCANIAIYAFLGTELIGITAGECEDPEKSIPKAIKTVFWRLALFYVLSIFVMAAILPWSDASVLVSPFTQVFKYAGIPYADTIMNIVVLTALLSSANSGLYASSRMLFAMAKEGKAPKILGRVNKRGIPVPALLVTLSMGLFAFLLKFMGADSVYIILVSASSLATIFAWIGISTSHYRFRVLFKRAGHSISELKFKALLYPFGPIFTFVVCAFGILSAYMNPTSRMTFYLGCGAFAIIWLIGVYLNKKGKIHTPTDDELLDQSMAACKVTKADESK
jgi:lysine-specific permease